MNLGVLSSNYCPFRQWHAVSCRCRYPRWQPPFWSACPQAARRQSECANEGSGAQKILRTLKRETKRMKKRKPSLRIDGQETDSPRKTEAHAACLREAHRSAQGVLGLRQRLAPRVPHVREAGDRVHLAEQRAHGLACRRALRWRARAPRARTSTLNLGLRTQSHARATHFKT